MSLDVYLINTKTLKCDCGKVHELETECVFSANITHNLSTMADKAGIYDSLWNGNIEDKIIKNAGELGDILTPAITRMDLNPDYYRQFNATNGWGTYEQFVPWLEELRDKCVEFPNAKIEISK